MTDPSALAAYREALAVDNAFATVQRVSGYAPNVIVVAAATVSANIRSVKPDANETSQAGLHGAGMGVIDQADREVMVLADDLAAAGFPLPVVKGDQVTLPDSAEILNVLRVDAYTRRFAGAILLTCVGVS